MYIIFINWLILHVSNQWVLSSLGGVVKAVKPKWQGGVAGYVYGGIGGSVIVRGGTREYWQFSCTGRNPRVWVITIRLREKELILNWHFYAYLDSQKSNLLWLDYFCTKWVWGERIPNNIKGVLLVLVSQPSETFARVGYVHYTVWCFETIRINAIREAGVKEGQGASIYNIRNTLVPYRCTGHVTTSVYPFTRSTEEVGSQLSLTYSLKTIPFLLQVKMKLPIIAALAS